MKTLLMAVCFSLFYVSAFAAEKVVVIPLNMKSTAADTATMASAGLINGCSISIAAGSNSDFCWFDEVPAGKILVVEFISGELNLPSGQSAEIRTATSHPSGFFTNHNVYLRYQRSSTTSNQYIVSQSFRMYIDEANSLGIRAIKSSTTDSSYGEFWISGYLVDKVN